MKNKKMFLGVVVILILTVVVFNGNEPANDVSDKYVGKDVSQKFVTKGFLHIGPVLTLHKEGKYILSIFNNTDTIEIEYYGLGKTNPVYISISQPLEEGLLLETVCPEGRYVITCGGKTKTYLSNGDKITISYR